MNLIKYQTPAAQRVLKQKLKEFSTSKFFRSKPPKIQQAMLNYPLMVLWEYKGKEVVITCFTEEDNGECYRGMVCEWKKVKGVDGSEQDNIVGVPLKELKPIAVDADSVPVEPQQYEWNVSGEWFSSDDYK